MKLQGVRFAEWLAVQGLRPLEGDLFGIALGHLRNLLHGILFLFFDAPVDGVVFLIWCLVYLLLTYKNITIFVC